MSRKFPSRLVDDIYNMKPEDYKYLRMKMRSFNLHNCRFVYIHRTFVLQNISIQTKLQTLKQAHVANKQR